MNKRFWPIFILLVFACLQGYSQLSDLHYLPPLKQGSNNGSVREQAIYLSTPESTAFAVNAYRGTSTTPIATFSISNATPARYDLPNGDNAITMVQNNNTGVVISNGGLRFEAPGGQKFYVNYRGSSGAQSTSLTSKGRQALGTSFKWGGAPNYGTTNEQGTSLGIMATEATTTVDIFGYDPNCEFREGNDRDGITSNTIQVVLNAGESFVLEAHIAETSANIDGWLGASIVSDKPIAISNGGLNYAAVNGSGGSRDAGIDQPVPEDNLGKDYIFVRGGGVNNTEFPIIIATQNNTQIFVNGSATPIATINNGEYFIVPGTNYSSGLPGANMYIRTSKDAYAYQNLAGTNGIQTVGLNFVAPLNCLIPDTVNNIPNITDAAGTTLTGGITIIASTTTPDANIIVTDGSGVVTKPASLSVAGNPDWKTFYIPNLTGNVDVQSTGPVAVGFFGGNGNRGIAGYFSGFDVAPNVDLQITGTQCLPGANLEVIGEVFDAYQWFFDGTPIAGATTTTYNPTVAGDYFVRVTKGPCTYDSNNLQAYYCNPDIQLIKTADASTVNEGSIVTFTITAQNFGVDPATNLVITDVLPTGLSLVSASPTVGSWSSPNWTIGTLTSGTLETISIVAMADTNNMTVPAQFPTNTATNTQDQIDSNITIDSPSASVTILNDFDGDGIMDITDLDDDNDGILDTIECGYIFGSGTLVDPFSSLYEANLATVSARYYFDLGSGVFEADVDTSNGGGWVLILQYVHALGTNPNLNIIGPSSNLPALSVAVLGDDESGSGTTWGHLGNSGLSALNAEELRWYAETTGHDRVIHFKSDVGLSYAETGTGNFSGINSSYTELTGHSANLPDAVANYFSNQGDLALTNFPYWLSGTYHWGIRGLGNRWEVDDYGRNTASTIHRIWARATTSPCADTDGDGLANLLDLDSDGDGCFDVVEADFTDENSDGVLGPVSVNVDSNGLVTSGSDGYTGTNYLVTDGSVVHPICGSDSDSDGVPDGVDLDDDNDGIYDNTECNVINHALTGTATQNSNYNSTLIAAQAINGNLGYPEAHTAGGTANDWWEVDLGELERIDEVKIWNRTACCSDRLSNMFVLISDTPFPSNTDLEAAQVNATFSAQLGDMNGLISVQVPFGIEGRYIRIQKSGTNPGGNWINIYELQALEYTFCDINSNGIPNYLDLDSDGDNCSDANEAYTNVNADGDDGGTYGSGTPSVNPDGTVIAASYPTPADIDLNGTYDFQEVGVAPTITIQPENQHVFLNNNGVFGPTASDADAYQWEVSTDGGTTFNTINDGVEYSGTQSDELSILLPNLEKNGYIYRAVLTSDTFVCGQTLTNAVVLTVGPRTIITNRRITIRVNKN